MLTFKSLGISAALLAVCDVVNNEFVRLNPNISNTVYKASSVYDKNYMDADADTLAKPWEFVHVNVTPPSASTLSFI